MAITVVMASGGINSTVAAMRAKQADDVHLFFVDYGQQAARCQDEALRSFAAASQLPITVARMPHVAELAALQRSQSGVRTTTEPPTLDIPSRVPGLMTVLLGAGMQLAHRIGAQSIHVGSSEAADELETASAPGEGRPDHRREFFYVCNLMLENLQKSKSPIRLETPLIDLTRDDIIKLGDRYDTPFDLTYACDAGQQPPCAACAGCLARTKAFRDAKLLDPAMATSGAAS